MDCIVAVYAIRVFNVGSNHCWNCLVHSTRFLQFVVSGQGESFTTNNILYIYLNS